MHGRRGEGEGPGRGASEMETWGSGIWFWCQVRLAGWEHYLVVSFEGLGSQELGL